MSLCASVLMYSGSGGGLKETRMKDFDASIGRRFERNS